VPYDQQSIARRLLENDPDAVGQLMRWISAALTVPRYWALREEWPDLLQEVVARILESLRQERFDGSRDLRVYAQGVARFASLEALARRRRRMSPAEAEPEPVRTDLNPESWAIQRELARRVLDLASQGCRELIRMYFYETRDYEEIAAKLEIPPGTVKSRLFRCLQSARQMLSRHHAPQGSRKSAGASMEPDGRADE